jgi:hypothetical protein
MTEGSDWVRPHTDWEEGQEKMMYNQVLKESEHSWERSYLRAMSASYEHELSLSIPRLQIVFEETKG